MKIVNRCLDCDTLNSFTDLLFKLKKIAKFDAAVCTCVEPSNLPISFDKVIQPVNHHFLKGLIDTWQLYRCYKIITPLQVFFTTLNLQDSEGITGRLGDRRLNIYLHPELIGNRPFDGWIYGAYEKCCNRWILFIFACPPKCKKLKSCIIIELSVPFLVHSFRNLKYLCTAQPYHLTKREYEVINWVKMGKTSWEIAKILNVSESCVNFHIENLKKKFNVINRTQAVAFAVGNGLIKL